MKKARNQPNHQMMTKRNRRKKKKKKTSLNLNPLVMKMINQKVIHQNNQNILMSKLKRTKVYYFRSVSYTHLTLPTILLV